MTSRRRADAPGRGTALVLRVLGALACVAGLGGCDAATPANPAPAHPPHANAVPATPVSRPAALLWSALPLMWGEVGVEELLAGGGARAPAADLLEARIDLRPIDAATDDVLADAAVLLAIQPHVPAPAELVAVDRWVRDGGRALLLVDPSLRWESRYAIGDPRRPPPFLPLAPLLTHWGLDIVADGTGGHDHGDGEADAVADMFELAGRTVRGGGVGRIATRTSACAVDGPVARCRIGRGEAVVVADADLLDPASAGDSLAENAAAIGDLVARLAAEAPTRSVRARNEE